MLEIMLNVISPIFIIIGLTAGLNRTIPIDSKTLSPVIIYLFAPALVIDGIANSELNANELGQIASMAISVPFILTAIGWVIARVLKFERQLESAFLLSLILVNAANFGIPLNTFAFGEEAEQYAVLYYTIQITVPMTFGIYLASRGTHSARHAISNVLRVPMTYAGGIGLAINFLDITLPLAISRTLAILGEGTVPLMLIVLGLQLANIRIQGQWGVILIATGLRLVAAPIIAIAMAEVLGLEGLIYNVTVVESSMPTAVMAGVLATEFGSDAEFATTMILVSTFLSIITLSILIAFL